eukprot:31478-Pelagococcus_subviridis.AAC.5
MIPAAETTQSSAWTTRGKRMKPVASGMLAFFASAPPRIMALRVVPYERTSGWSRKASDGVERRRGRGLKARGGRRDAAGKVLRNGVHHADAVVRGPVYRTRLITSAAIDSKRSAPRALQSPTLSPTRSAITAGFLGSSSGIPASTLPTRSAPTSAAFV